MGEGGEIPQCFIRKSVDSHFYGFEFLPSSFERVFLLSKEHGKGKCSETE